MQRSTRPQTASSYKHQLLLSTSYKPKKKMQVKDDLLFKELSIEIITGIIHKSLICM